MKKNKWKHEKKPTSSEINNIPANESDSVQESLSQVFLRKRFLSFDVFSRWDVDSFFSPLCSFSSRIVEKNETREAGVRTGVWKSTEPPRNPTPIEAFDEGDKRLVE